MVVRIKTILDRVAAPGLAHSWLAHIDFLLVTGETHRSPKPRNVPRPHPSSELVVGHLGLLGSCAAC